MGKSRFIIVGSGWRSLFYVRIAKALDDKFELCAMLCRTKEKADLIKKEYNIYTTTSVLECEKLNPDFVVVAVNKSSICDVSIEWLKKRFAVLCETPAAMNINDLHKLWKLKENGCKLCVAEQYWLYPKINALLSAASENLIGEPYSTSISVAHEYHAASLIKKILKINNEKFTITGKRYTYPIVETATRYEKLYDGKIVDKNTDKITIEFENGKTAFYDFSSEQYRSPIRSNYISIKGNRGEIINDEIIYLDDENKCKRCFIDDKFKNNLSFDTKNLSDDEIAITLIMDKMKDFSLGGEEPYPLKAALDDAYIGILMRKAVENPGMIINSIKQPWNYDDSDVKLNCELINNQQKKFENNSVRYAIVGIGNMGKKYASLIDSGNVCNSELTCIVCRNETGKQWIKDNIQSKVNVYSSVDELFLEKDKFDVVMIVTPHKTHPEIAIKAFECGKNVFCDKPAGVSVMQANKMNEAAKKSKKLYGMMFHQRMYKKYITIKRIIDNGDLGKISRVMLVNSRYYRTKHYHDSGTWRSSWKGEGGAALINQGQHIIDIWQWLFGLPEAIYSDVKFGKYNDFSVDDEVSMIMEYPDNMSAIFVLTTGEAVWEERLEIVGTKGKILLEDDNLTVWKYDHDSMEYGKTANVNSRENLEIKQENYHFEKATEPYAEMIENFSDAVNGKTSLISPGQAGYNVLLITNAAYLSSWKKEKIKLPVDEEEYNKYLKEAIDKESTHLN